MLHKVGERPVQLFLELSIGDDEVSVVASACEANSFGGSRVQLVETR